MVSKDQTETDNAKVPWYLKPGYKIEHLLSAGYFKLAQKICNWPKLTLVISLVVSLALLAGYPLRDEQSAVERIWVPQDSVAIKHQRFVVENYGAGFRIQQALIVGNPEGTNVLTQDILQEAFQIHQFITDISVNYNGEDVTLDSLCARPFPNAPFCLKNGVLDYWKWNSSALAQDSNIVQTINDPNARSLTGATLEARLLLGGFERDQIGNIISASALMLTYFVNAPDEDAEKVARSEAWEEKFIETIRNFQSDKITAYVSADRSLSDELGNAIQGDLLLIVVAYILMLIYVSSTLGKLEKKLVKSKILLGIAGLILVTIATFASFGFCAYIGELTTPPNQVLPFLMIGIGVDDMYVIVNCFEQTPKNLPLKERVAMGLSMAGTSITITSLTDIFAFGVGATSRLPAIRSFCIHAALAILFDWILQVTAFVVLMYYDAKRRMANRMDVFPCIKRAAGSENNDEKKSEDFLTRVIRDYYAPTLLKNPVKIGVIILFAIILGIGIWGASGVKQDFDLRDLAPKGSYLIDFITKDNKYFSDVGTTVNFYFKQEDYSNLITQDKILSIQQGANDIRFIEDSSLSSWLINFLTWVQNAPNVTLVNGRPEEDQFYPLLENFLEISGQRFKNDIVFSQDGSIVTSRFGLRYDPLNDASTQVSALKTTREFVDKRNDDVDFFAFSFSFIFWEQYAIIISEAISNLGLAAAGVFIITFFLLIHPGTALIVVGIVILIDVNLIGYMRFWGVDIDSVSVINLVMAIGLAVDYSCHIAHSFMIVQGTRHERVIKALESMGPSVLSGAFTTFLGTLPLAFSSSVIFFTFFRMFFGTVIFGITHGMILVPVILSMVGPRPLNSSKLYHNDQSNFVEELNEA